MSDKEYQIALTIFFVSYGEFRRMPTSQGLAKLCHCCFKVAVEIPSNLALKVLRPQYWITGNMILWAVCTVCLGVVKTGPQLIAVRFLLGLFEGGLFPGLNFIFSLYYTREELGQRVAIFFAGATRGSSPSLWLLLESATDTL